MQASIFTIYGGMAFVAASFISLCFYSYCAFRNSGSPRRSVWLKLIIGIALILTNFLAGVAGLALIIFFARTSL